MNTEDALQAAIDANPEEQTPRGELADCLLENGDPRGPGYQALFRLGRRPCPRAMPGYHNGVGTSEFKLSEISRVKRTREIWLAMSKSQRTRSQRQIGRFTLPADPIHALPPTWYRACWGEKWWSDEDVRMEWVMSSERRRLDDLVAEAFTRTPKGFQAKILEGSLPIQFPFIWICPGCAGHGFPLFRDPEPLGTRGYWLDGDGRVSHSKPSPRTRRGECPTCKGRGIFREDDGNG